MIAYGVNIATFDQNMQYLQNEIQKFNLNMELCDLPRLSWTGLGIELIFLGIGFDDQDVFINEAIARR